MKKVLVLAAIVFAFIAAPVQKSEAQTFIRLKQGAAADTLKASDTKYTDKVSLNFAQIQCVSATVFIDSISGTPAGTATLQQSVDGANWNTAGTAISWSTGVDTSFIVSLNPFLGAWARVKLVATSATQKSKYTITLRSANVD